MSALAFVGSASGADEPPMLLPLVGYNEHRTNLPGGRHANVSTNRAMVVKADSTDRRSIGGELVNEAGTWTQFAGWSPDGETAVVLRGWESVENAQWEEEHKTFRFTPEGWLVDSYLVDVATGKVENVTGVERVSFYNSGLFFWPDDPTKLGFTALIGGNSKPFSMDRDGRNKTDLTKNSNGFAYGFSSSPDGSLDRLRFGALALSALLAEETSAAESPLTARRPHFAARAKRVIFLFMPGGPSQVDRFDPKPRLSRDDGQPSPKLYLGQQRKLLGSPWKFQKYGQSGLEVSELFPRTATCIDDICVIRSMVTDDPNHPGGCLLMNTGERVFSRPSIGSWVTYGLGTENQNLPGFVAIGPGPIIEGARQYGASFLPAAYQGTFVSNLAQPLRNLSSLQVPRERQRRELDALARLNALHREPREDDDRLSARIESFELAFRMQTEAPEAFDLAGETSATGQMYGLDQPTTEMFGRQCLLARRLVERGVRFVQLYHTTGGFQPWDQHSGLKAGHENNALATDQPIAGLLQDLKSRGLLDETLVIWGGEFGRTPTAEGKDGRDHHPFGFSMWLAGGGVRGGMTYGATDEFGWDAIENRVHVHDLHATILHLLGLDHERLTYHHAGRDFRLTDVHGSVVTGLLAAARTGSGIASSEMTIQTRDIYDS